jgi:FtsZ-interacting cell division protein ZipA
MNDLQMVLIVIGGVIIAAVLVFNWWQERRFHKQVESSFSNVNSDALLEHASPEASLSIEPVVSATPIVEEPSSDADNSRYAKADFDQDDFSIDHDSFKETSGTKQEPHIEITENLTASLANASNSAYAEPEIDSIPADDIAAVVPTAFVSAPSAFDDPLVNSKPANHDGIKAIFEGVFNKLESLDDSQNNGGDMPVGNVSAEAVAPSLPAALHAQVDLIAKLYLNAELTIDAVTAALKNVFDDFDKPVFVHVLTSGNHWQLLSEVSSQPGFKNQQISIITCSLQLADRAGPVSRGVVNRFQLAVETLGMDIDAHVEWQSTSDPVVDATALDTFCIDVDKTMGFHLMHGENGAFTGTKLRGLAEAQGLELAADGTFKYFSEAVKSQDSSVANPQMPSFVMFNRDHHPFSPDMLRSSVVKAITFQLDIPHVKNCTEAFNHMVQVAKQMETGLNAQLVDDNNRPLGDVQIEKIRHQLKIIQATMLTRGIAAGSDCAHRLFS